MSEIASKIIADAVQTSREQFADHRAVPLAVREYDRMVRDLAEFRALLTECLEYLEPLQDVRDGSYGAQEPNREMSLCTAIKLALGELP